VPDFSLSISEWDKVMKNLVEILLVKGLWVEGIKAKETQVRGFFLSSVRQRLLEKYNHHFSQ
jgi:hypothetical protein